MKHIIKLTLLAFLSFYLIFSFTQWNLNPADWETAVRGGCMYSGSMGAVILNIIKKATEL